MKSNFHIVLLKEKRGFSTTTPPFIRLINPSPGRGRWIQPPTAGGDGRILSQGKSLPFHEDDKVGGQTDRPAGGSRRIIQAVS